MSETTKLRRRATAADLQCMLMTTDLCGVLDRVEGSRYVLRHLAMLEHRLRRDGLAAIDGLPLPALRKCAAQLESVLKPPVPQGVASLRARLDVALLARERVERSDRTDRLARPEPPAAAPEVSPARAKSPAHEAGGPPPHHEWLSSFLTEEKLVVSETTPTDFQRVSRAWEDHPAGPPVSPRLPRT